MPVYNNVGHEIGMCTKRFPEQFIRKDADRHYYDTQEKSILYMSNDRAAVVHFPKNSDVLCTHRPLVVVEDIISATRLRQFGESCALLGTALSTEKVKAIRESNSRIILALDSDATTKAIKYKQEYSLFFNEFKVVQLEKDPKDLSQTEILKQIFGEEA